MGIKIERLYEYFNECNAITTDSREVKELVDKGEKVMFFALKGDNFNGNKFAIKSLEMGAIYAVVDDNELSSTDGLIVVNDVLTTLTELATYHRSKLKFPHLAITGSNGKTTTKELTQVVLSKNYKCHATFGNLNNHIGVPLTILRTPKDADFSIIEMGANHRDEIAHLAKIAQPTHGIITNIGKAHLEGFGGGDGVKLGKGELFDYISKNNGTAFYLSESEPIVDLISKYSTLNSVEYTIADITKITNDKESEKLTVGYFDNIIKSQLVGDYNIYNIRASIAIGEHFGVTPNDIKEALESYIPTNNRSQLIEHNGYHIVIDAYNANPSSMELSIKNFDSINSKDKIIILGDMKELGTYSLEEHINILKISENMKSENSTFYFVGEEFEDALNKYEFTQKYFWFKDALSLSENIEMCEYKDKWILIKGSNSTRLSSLIKCFS